MKFLEHYKSIAAFKNQNKGFETLKNKPDYFFMGGDLPYLLDLNGVDLSKSPAKETYAVLLTKYPEQEIYYGLATLCGVGKGRNEIVEQRGTYIAKFSDWEKDVHIGQVGFYVKMDRTVELARKLVRVTADAFTAPEHAILDAAVHEHFLLDRKDPLWAAVGQNFKNIRQFLDGMFRLAANNPSEVKGATGYVIFKRIEEGSPVSPYKTSGAPTADANGPHRVTHGGSIHMDYGVFRDDMWTDLGVAAVIVHEASHKICATDDHAYVHDGEKYVNLSKALRVDNADCYGFVAASVYAKKVFTTEKTSTLSPV